jgi:hypothetical protein
MTRKRTKRRVVSHVPPWLRPKLSPGQVLDLSLVHWQNLDQIARGEGTSELLWQVFGGVLTWWRVSQQLARIGRCDADIVAGMGVQLEVVARLAERYKATGRVVFTGEEYQQAKLGCELMDALAEAVDKPTAVEAAEWSDQRVNALSGSMH